jgi:hypothetical protein
MPPIRGTARAGLCMLKASERSQGASNNRFEASGRIGAADPRRASRPNSWTPRRLVARRHAIQVAIPAGSRNEFRESGDAELGESWPVCGVHKS